MKTKSVCVFVIENKLGGVAYMNLNIINNTTLGDTFYKRVILVDEVSATTERFKDEFTVEEVVHFKYHIHENKYAVLKRLSNCIGEEEGVLVCNDGLEMEAIHLFPTPKTVYQIIHDFYNLKLAVKYSSVVDVYLTHTELFRDVLLSADPATIKSIFLPHGVALQTWEPKNNWGKLKIVFTGRLVEGKGVRDLFLINQILKAQNIITEWTIIGRGPLESILKEQWLQEDNIRFISPDTNKQVLSEMSRHDLFVLPTRFEGSPVTVLEALSCGLVPIVSDLPAGIKEIITPNIGKRVKVGDIAAFADAIIYFHKNRQVLFDTQQNCRLLAESNFNIKNTSNKYLEEFLKYKTYKKQNNIAVIKVGFRLDQPWLPNWIVKGIRNQKSIFK